jgi:hypothetical protein
MTLTTSDTGYNDKDELINIPIVTHYTITPEVYEPNCASGVFPAEWEVQKIWYGDVRYNSLEDLASDFPGAAREIESLLDDEIENFDENNKDNGGDFGEYESNNER